MCTLWVRQEADESKRDGQAVLSLQAPRTPNGGAGGPSPGTPSAEAGGGAAAAAAAGGAKPKSLDQVIADAKEEELRE
eukprot:1823770-Pyramimonas_sp.AAC.1